MMCKPICSRAFSLFTADILQANDSLTYVINLYRQLVKGEDVSVDGITTPSQPSKLMGVRTGTLQCLRAF